VIDPPRATPRPGPAGLLAAGLPRLLSPGTLQGVAREAAWTCLHLTTYPLGLLREGTQASDRYHLDGLGPAQRGLLVHDVEAAGTPILLVHGMIDNRAIFTVLKHRLHRKGLRTIASMNYPLLTNDIRGAARELGAVVEALAERTGYEQIHVIGHSMGGLIARYYVQRLGGDRRVHTLVTLGTPHAGSAHGHLLPVELCRQLRPGSELMAELELPAPDCGTRFVAYWSDLDHVIVPHHNARIDHPDLAARNVLVRDVGHLSLPRVGRVGHEIAALLSRVSPEVSRTPLPDVAERADGTA